MNSTKGSIDRASLDSVGKSIVSGWRSVRAPLLAEQKRLTALVLQEKETEHDQKIKQTRGLLSEHQSKQWVSENMNEEEVAEAVRRRQEALEKINVDHKNRLQADYQVTDAQRQLALTQDELCRIDKVRDYWGRTGRSLITAIARTDWSGLSVDQKYEVDQFSLKFPTPAPTENTVTASLFLRLKSTGTNASARGTSQAAASSAAGTSVPQPKPIRVEVELSRLSTSWQVTKAPASIWPEEDREPGATSEGWVNLDTEYEKQ